MVKTEKNRKSDTNVIIYRQSYGGRTYFKSAAPGINRTTAITNLKRYVRRARSNRTRSTGKRQAGSVDRRAVSMMARGCLTFVCHG
eukprot:scaffold255261_cov17-Prasinocladus_malaysianus.AAC.1